ncbi:MAG: Crp/Fnr family transcriptional regulator [Alphaproteobacteria bacterium]|nr:Crp/Fnr family transcriptional regulator [Alphaproteobacteria bacterium]
MHTPLGIVRARRPAPSGLTGFLHQLPAFAGHPPDAVVDLGDLAETRSASRGEVLWQPGDKGDTVVIVRSGVVLLRRDVGEHGVTLDVCGRGAFLGLAPGPRDHEAVVHDGGTLLVVPRSSFDAWLVDHAELAPAMVGLAAAQAQRMASRLTLVSMHGARARLALLLLDLADRFGVRDSRGVIVDVRLTHREMAALIGATRETVSVAIVELRNAGVVETEARRVVVVDEAALAEVAGV